MSKADAHAFIDQMRADPDLQKKVSNLIVQLGANAGRNFTRDEYDQAIAERQMSGDLSRTDLSLKQHKDNPT